jgi:predicted MFS family arabinose efflux permease
MFREVLSNRQFQNLAVSHFNTTFSINIIVPVLPVFLAAKGFAETQIGLIIGAAALSSLLVRPWVGMQIDTRGSGPVMMVGQLMLILSIAGLLFVDALVSFIGLRLAFGVAMAFYGTSAVTYASSIGTGRTTANAVAMYTLITMIGLGLSMSLSQLIFDSYGFTAIALIISALTASAFCVMKFRAGSFEPRSSSDKHAPFMSVLRVRAVLAASLGHFGGSFAFGSILTFIPLAAIQGGVAFYSIFFICFSVSVICSRFFVQRVIEALGIEKACIYAYAAMLLGALPLLLPLTPAILIVSGLFFGAGFGITFPAFVLLLVKRIKAESRGTALGILIAAGDTANALSIAFLGGIAEHFGYLYLFLTIVMVLMVCMYMFYSLIHDRKKSGSGSVKAV